MTLTDELAGLRDSTDQIVSMMAASAAKRREAEREPIVEEVPSLSRHGLPMGLAHIFRAHLRRHPRERWKLADDREVKVGCSCGAQLTLTIGVHVCSTEECDRVWFWTGRGVFHAHPEQLATDE